VDVYAFARRREHIPRSLSFIFRENYTSLYEEKTNTERMIIMLPVAVVKIVEIAVGYAVGVKASDALDKGIEVVKKVVEAKKKGSK
jgi:hypothetical protein